MSKQVLVVIPVEERHKEYLENKGTGCVFTYTSPKAVTEEELANAQIIIGSVKGRGSAHECDRCIWAGNLRAYVRCYAYDAETPGRILCKPEKPSVEG